MNVSEAVYALRDLLDANIELRALMGTKEGDTKVFVRNTLLEAAQFPLILISDFVYAPTPMGQRKNLHAAAIDTSIFAMTMNDGSDDLGALCQMASLVEGIVRDYYSGDAGDCRYVGFRLQEAKATQTIDKYSVKVLTFQGQLSEVA